MMKKALVICLLTMSFVTSGYTRPDVYQIDPVKNAISHNNKGLEALDGHDYYAAIQEFTLAVLLNPRTQATAVYYNNLGDAYMKIGYFKDAQGCFEKAIKQYNLNFLYYQNLVKSFKAQKILATKIKVYELKTNKDPMNMIVLGLMYVECGDVRRGIIKLDEFCMTEPDLLITDAVRCYIKQIVPRD